MSWPNTSPEKVFILKSQKVATAPKLIPSQDVTSVKSEGDTPVHEFGDCKPQESYQTEASAPTSSIQVIPEILTITHDHKNPFQVDFDDPSWKTYIDHLKPIGLSILMNT